ncbi:PAS domain S-box protein [Methanoregula sp.]|uniref:PAS domain S-box protein n=1 Tax=Methanoregula sp. TaxID=2052170 RepID=UPI003C353292
MYNLLYVDDEDSLLDLTKLYMELSGEFSVDTATSAKEAIGMLVKRPYAAIISDYQMPDMDGIEFLKKVRTSGNTIPFILFTGRGREEIAIQALNEGADFYLQKGGEPKSQFTELAHQIRQAVQQRKAEISIRDLERREADIINFLPDATFAIDTKGVVIAWNRAIEEMTGVSAAAMLGKGDYEYAIPFYGQRQPILINLIYESDEIIAKKYTHIIHRKDVLIAETTLPRPQGKPVTLMGKASPLYNRQDEVIGAIESIRDLTEREQAEGALRESENRFRELADLLPQVVYEADTEGNLTYSNHTAFERFGYREDDFTHGLTIWQMIAPDDLKRVSVDFRTMIEGKGGTEHTGEYLALRKDGSTFPVTIYSSPIVVNGRITGLRGIIIDITERKRAEEALRQANRKLALLTNITRHDIDNQILALNGFVELLHEKIPDPALEKYFTWIKQVSTRISSISLFAKTYTIIGETAPAWQDIRTLVDTAAKQASLGNIQVKNDLSAGIELFADPLIFKVFYNLIENAVRYGRKITTIQFFAEEVDGVYIVVCEDDGEGILGEDKGHIFDWGFGKNTGLGLALSREILAISKITIRETGKPGKGARFEILVPKGTYRLADVQ